MTRSLRLMNTAQSPALTVEGAELGIRIELCHPHILRLQIGDSAGDARPYLHQRPATLAGKAAGLSVNAEGRTLDISDGDGNRQLRLDLASMRRHGDLRLGFEAAGEQHFYGLGHGGAGLDRLGVTRRFWNCHVNYGAGADIAIPLLLSDKGYGLFFDDPTLSLLDPGPSGDAICFDYVTPANSIDLYLLMGDGLAGTLGLVAQLLGRASMPPRWALGYLQSTRHFESREELLEVAGGFAEKGLPCDALILLSSYGRMLGWNRGVGHLEVQPRLFADATDLVSGIKQAGLRVITHEYPVVHEDSALYAEAEERGFLLGAAYPDLPQAERTAVSYHEGQRYFDFNDTAAASWWWDQHEALCAAGVDGWWLDGGDGPPGAKADDGGHNRYDLARQAAFAAGEARDRPARRPFLLCRSGGPGMQRWGAACWSGDVNASFASLEAQLALGLNMGLSGVPLWGTDTGGYYPTDSADPELFVRWFQLSAFTPIFRAHGRRWREHLPWSHGPEVEAICRRYMELRYRLLPYTYTLCRQAHLRGLPLMRPLVLAYPDDPTVKDLANPYLWGPDILVAPVTRAGATRWPVYLPRGTWHDYWTGAVFDGGRAVEVAAPLDRLPLFVRGGAILPLADVASGHRPARALQLLVYPQGRSQLSLYDDDGESTAYRTGRFAETTITCDAAAVETVIGIERPTGEPAVLPPGRTYELRIRAEATPRSVTLTDGSPVHWRMEPTNWLVLAPVEGPAGIRIGW